MEAPPHDLGPWAGYRSLLCCDLVPPLTIGLLLWLRTSSLHAGPFATIHKADAVAACGFRHKGPLHQLEPRSPTLSDGKIGHSVCSHEFGRESRLNSCEEGVQL